MSDNAKSWAKFFCSKIPNQDGMTYGEYYGHLAGISRILLDKKEYLKHTIFVELMSQEDRECMFRMSIMGEIMGWIVTHPDILEKTIKKVKAEDKAKKREEKKK